MKVLCNGMHITKLQHGHPVKWATKVLPSLRSCLHGTPVVGGTSYGNLIMSSTWIFARRYWYYAARFGGTARLLQSYFAVAMVAFIVIWLCTLKIVILLCSIDLIHTRLFLITKCIFFLIEHIPCRNNRRTRAAQNNK